MCGNAELTEGTCAQGAAVNHNGKVADAWRDMINVRCEGGCVDYTMCNAQMKEYPLFERTPSARAASEENKKETACSATVLRNVPLQCEPRVV